MYTITTSATGRRWGSEPRIPPDRPPPHLYISVHAHFIECCTAVKVDFELEICEIGFGRGFGLVLACVHSDLDCISA